MSAVAESEELRALSFVRRCVLKKNEKIRELSKKCAKMEEQIQNLKWKCSDLEKENERLSSALTWDDAKHSNGTGGSSVVGIPGVEENLQFSDTAASTSVKKELAELDFSRVDPAFRTDELGTSETEHSTSGGTVPSGVGQRKRTLTADATDPDTLPGAPGNTARKKARSIASRTDPDTGDVTGSGDQLNQSAASTEDDYIDDSVQPLDHEDVSNHSNSNFTATQYLPNASSVVGELLPEGAAEMDPQQTRCSDLASLAAPPFSTVPPPPAEPRQNQCHVCGYTAYGKAKLARHMRVHTGERPFACPYGPACTYRATQRAHLDSHVSVRHPDHEWTMCPVNQCSRRFVSSDQLQPHLERFHVSLL